MLLLVLIALAQLALLVMILGVVTGQASQREAERNLAGKRIRRLQHQTIEAMFAAATEPDDIDRQDHGLYPRL